MKMMDYNKYTLLYAKVMSLRSNDDMKRHHGSTWSHKLEEAEKQLRDYLEEHKPQ